MHIVYKKLSETPLQCIQRLFNIAKNTYTYAGRLDPMAEGLLIILKNEECKNAKQYHNLGKTYEYTFIVGISTDTYDCLGKITHTNYPKEDIREKVKKVISTLTKKQMFAYPPYSSKTINGKPLFEYARQNKLNTIHIPTNPVYITEHSLTETQTTDTNTLVKEMAEKIKRVTGDFRQKEILQDWKSMQSQKIQHFSATITTGAGTYIRAIVHEIGKQVGYPTVTTSIKRTKVGKWTKTGTYGQ